MSGSEREGNNRRGFRRRNRDNDRGRRREENVRFAPRERPRWTPPQTPEEPIPTPDCPRCGKPIRDISAALQDKETGEPIHFDCVIARIAEGESLEEGDRINYIGGGRFGVVHYSNPQDPKSFRIKKIFEWENKDNRADWRRVISDYYSAT